MNYDTFSQHERNGSLEVYFGRLDKTNPNEFQHKSDFYYKYADIIINSHPQMNDYTYLDVLRNYLSYDNILNEKEVFKKRQNRNVNNLKTFFSASNEKKMILNKLSKTPSKFNTITYFHKTASPKTKSVTKTTIEGSKHVSFGVTSPQLQHSKYAPNDSTKQNSDTEKVISKNQSLPDIRLSKRASPQILQTPPAKEKKQRAPTVLNNMVVAASDEHLIDDVKKTQLKFILSHREKMYKQKKIRKNVKN